VGQLTQRIKLNSYKPIPPPLATRLLHSFLRDDLAEEVSGDLEEKFYATLKSRSVVRAHINYWYQVINYLRPFAIRKLKPINTYQMYNNYFKVGLRGLMKNTGYSFINIGGLALGMTITILIGLWVHDELTFDHYFTHFNRIVQVMQHQTNDGNTSSQMSIPMPLGNSLREEYGSDFVHLSMASWQRNQILGYGDKSITRWGNYVEPDFIEMFSVNVIHGDRHALKDVSSILLSESAAKALFGDEDPLNKSIRLSAKADAKVSGVYKDFPYNTTFKDVDYLAPWQMFVNSEPWLQRSVDRWNNNSFQLFAQIADEADVDLVSKKIEKIKANHDPEQVRFNPQIFLFPMDHWHLRSKWINGVNAGGQIQVVWLFATIGVFVLLLACINFMNLSTARSEKRAKEVGIRITVGSVRSQLINQFLTESFLVVLIAFGVALGLISFSLPVFNELAAKQIQMPWTQPGFWFTAVGFIILTSLLAGSYPAFYLSSFRPVKILKGTFKVGRFASLPRKVLVVVQFTVSVTLIIGTAIVYQQIQHSQNRPVGYDRNGLMMIEKKTPDFNGKYDILKSELTTNGAIIEMAESSSPMYSIWANNGGFVFEGLDPEFQYSDFATVWVSPEYGKTVGWKMKQGRDFSRIFSMDSMAVLVNESALQFLGGNDVIGKQMTWGSDNYHIVGVVEDMIMESPYRAIRPGIYFCDYTDANWFFLRLNPNKSVQESMGLIANSFKKHISSAPFDYRFADETYSKKFDTEVRLGKLTTSFSALAILISCLGIFGLVSFVAEQRTKEIGIRRVLGASVYSLWQMLSKDFLWLVVIASMLAVPMAVYLLNDWLNNYEYRITISWWIPFVSVSGAVLITLATISFQAIRAARMNPVKSLRSE
jgi:putative ABC transport system permease protein